MDFATPRVGAYSWGFGNGCCIEDVGAAWRSGHGFGAEVGVGVVPAECFDAALDVCAGAVGAAGVGKSSKAVQGFYGGVVLGLVGVGCFFFALRVATVAEVGSVKGCAEGFATGDGGGEVVSAEEVVQYGGVGGGGGLCAGAGSGSWVCGVWLEGDGPDGIERFEEGCWYAANGIAEGFCSFCAEYLAVNQHSVVKQFQIKRRTSCRDRFAARRARACAKAYGS